MALNTEQMKPLMVMGTSSGAGKSLIVTALCRIFSDMGIKVAPFKVQNMSLNAGVGVGGEMAYAQIIQAKAARIEPTVDMNPILLKPEGGKTHIVLQGKYYGTYEAGKYFTQNNDFFMERAMDSFNRLRKKFDLIIIEGAGSPAEINIKNDIANLKFSRLVDAANILVADIERGGVFASIVGTLELTGMKNLIGIIVNKFRGDVSLLKSGYEAIEEKYNVFFIGTVPFIENNIPQEDSLYSYGGKSSEVNVGVIKTPYMSNETDYEIFKTQKGLGLTYINKPEELEKSDIIVIPGSKITVEDLYFLKREGFEDRINYLKKDKWIVGICGGLQMMGRYILDADETGKGKVDGLNLLDIRTRVKGDKIARTNSALIIHPLFKGIEIKGYEIHRGKSYAKENFSIINEVDGKHVRIPDGSYKDRIFGTYIHGLFENIDFTEKLINKIRIEKGMEEVKLSRGYFDSEIQNFADKVKSNINYELILESLR